MTSTTSNTNMVTITSENVHAWLGLSGQVLADIPKGYGLSYFATWDNLINYLYLSGFKQSAREINLKLKKESGG